MTGIGCKLLKSSSSGRGTGLEIFLSKFNESDVQVNNVAEFPEAGMGILVPMGHRSKMVSTVKLTLTESSPQIQSLPMEKRGCYFKGEYTLRITTEYTFKNCLIQCRMDFIKSICGCLPYYFNEGF
ncbi:hypothetical protein AAG570_002272 [Ranatra chinensis]|uniref:Uncharacterized protein n=1 Tax=Ranatra chinensis TaxID=642074 RepID=A0ABD0Y717_9HEMI